MNPLILSVTGLSTASFAPVNNDVATSLNQEATVASTPLFPQQSTSGPVNSFLSAANGLNPFTSSSPAAGSNIDIGNQSDQAPSANFSGENSAANFASNYIEGKLGAEADSDCHLAFKYGGMVAGWTVGVIGGGIGGAIAGGIATAGPGSIPGAVGGMLVGGFSGAAAGYGLGKEIGNDQCPVDPNTPAATNPTGSAPAGNPAVDEGTYIGEVDDPNFVTGSGKPDEPGPYNPFPTNPGGSSDNGPQATDGPAPATDSTPSPSDNSGPAATETTQPDPAPVPDGDLPPDDASGTSSGPAGPRSDFMPADDSVGGGTPRSNAANVASLAAASASALQLIALSRTQIA